MIPALISKTVRPAAPASSTVAPSSRLVPRVVSGRSPLPALQRPAMRSRRSPAATSTRSLSFSARAWAFSFVDLASSSARASSAACCLSSAWRTWAFAAVVMVVRSALCAALRSASYLPYRQASTFHVEKQAMATTATRPTQRHGVTPTPLKPARTAPDVPPHRCDRR